MPILKKQPDIFPDNLLEEAISQDASSDESANRQWHVIYTFSRREKELMRWLYEHRVSFYSPLVAKRYRSPKGRLRVSYIPLFSNYVFVNATEAELNQSFASKCICRVQNVQDATQLLVELRSIFNLIATGAVLNPESKLEKGQRARVRSGPFTGYEGTVIRREGKTRLLIWIDFIEQGVSLEIDEGLLTPI